MKFDIITIGSATRDVFLESSDFRDVRSREFPGGVGECLSLGSKNEVNKIFFTTGGGATNAAVTFARLGLKTACVVRVGEDDAASEIIKVLHEEGVNTKFIQKDKKDNTAYSTLLMHGPGERTILVYRGASTKLSFGPRLRRNLSFEKCKWFYITSLGGNLKLISQIWQFARKHGIKIAWNPGGEELKFGFRRLSPLIKQSEVFNVNREEATKLTNCEWQDEACFTGNLRNLATIVLVTDGARGAYAYFGKNSFFVSSLGTKARNTTGAGDAFGSGFVAGLMLADKKEARLRVAPAAEAELRKIRSALRLAILNADSVIRHLGAKTGILKKMPPAEEFNKVRIKDLRFKI